MELAAHDRQAYEMHAYEMSTHEMPAYEIHASERGTSMITCSAQEHPDAFSG